MNRPSQGSRAAHIEEFLSNAYRRILRITIVLSLAAATAASLLWDWRKGLALAAGALLACLNFVWLHHGTELAVQRMLPPTSEQRGPSTYRLMLAFAGRYLFVMAIAYVIFKGYPQTRIAFVVGLVLPIIGAMCEGVYEALLIGKTDQTPDQRDSN